MRHANVVLGLLLIFCLMISLQVKADNGIMKPVNGDVNATVEDAAGNTYVGRFCQGSGGDLGYAVTKYDQRSDPVWIVRYNDPSGNIEFEVAIEVDENQSVYLKLRDKKTREDFAAVNYDRYGRMLWVKRTGKAVSSYPSGIEKDLNFFTDDRQLPYLEGWPCVVTMGVFTTSQSIVGANFNPDDIEEELALCLCEGVYAWNHDGTVMDGWPVTQDYNYRGASICVQEGTGKLSCSSSESNGYVHVFRHDGMEDTGWPIITGGNISRGSMRADIDENAVLDVLHGGGYPNYAAYAWDSDASALPGWPIGLTQNVTGIAIGDVNDDGELEMVYTSTSLWNKRIWVISSSGQILHEWQPQVYFGAASENCPVLADLDEDGDLEIIWGGYADFFVWHHDGTECWPGQILPGGGDVSPAAIGDLDGDGSPEVVACNSSVIFVWNSDGTLYEGEWPKRIPNTSLTWSGVEHSGPVIGDIDEDGEQEIIINGYHTTSGRWFVMAFNPDGSRVRGFPCVEPPGYYPSCTPVIIDLDGDGDIEICSYAESHPSPAYGYLRVVVYDLPTPYNAANVDWPMRQHDAQRTGCYGGVEDIQLKEANQRVAEAGSPIRLEQSSPNPMHSTATIQYAISSPTPVRLDIYNVLGQKVRTLIEGHKSPGQYVASWDGKDGAGLDVANGVYIYYLEADSRCEYRKLLLIK